MIALPRIESRSHPLTFFFYMLENLLGRNVLVLVLPFFNEDVASVLELLLQRRLTRFLCNSLVTWEVIVEADSRIIWYTSLAGIIFLMNDEGRVKFVAVVELCLPVCGSASSSILVIVDSWDLLDLLFVHSEALWHLLWSHSLDSMVERLLLN